MSLHRYSDTVNCVSEYLLEMFLGTQITVTVVQTMQYSLSSGPPVVVRCSFSIISFGPFSEVNMVSKEYNN